MSNAAGREPALRGDGRGSELYDVTHLKEASPLVLLRICIATSLKNSGKIKILSEKKIDNYFSPMTFLTLRLLHLLVCHISWAIMIKAVNYHPWKQRSNINIRNRK